MDSLSDKGGSASPAATEAVRYSRGQQAYVLLVLVIVYTSNFIDRTIVGTIGQPIKEDLGLADWQLGLMGGLAFALFYTAVGLPIARLADRHNRVNIIAISLAVWSAMTALCGLAQNFVHLVLARVGVGIGEAGGTPPAHSIIADYFPPEKRATALGIYGLGIPLGMLFGALGGGWIAHHFSWREAFMVVGLPGLALALLLKLTLREPPRGVFDRERGAEGPPPNWAAVMKAIVSEPAMLLVYASMAIASVSQFALAAFSVPFLLRGFEVNVFQAGAGYGLVNGIAAAVGTGAGGYLADLLGKRRPQFRLIVPGAAKLVAGVLYICALFQRDLTIMAVLAAAAAALHFLHTGPAHGFIHNNVPANMRARAAAVFFLVLNLVGLGLGPVLVGVLSDGIGSQIFAGAGQYLAMCPGGLAAPGTPPETAALCRTASFEGLRWALLIILTGYFAAGLMMIAAPLVRSRRKLTL